MEDWKNNEKLLPDSQPSVATGSLIQSLFGDWQLTQWNGDGLEGKAKRISGNELSWVS